MLADVIFCRTIADLFLPFSSIKIGGRLSAVKRVQLTVSDEEADEMAQRVYKKLIHGSRASSFAATSVRSSPTTSGGSNRAPKPPDLRLTQPVVSPARLAP